MKATNPLIFNLVVYNFFCPDLFDQSFAVSWNWLCLFLEAGVPSQIQCWHDSTGPEDVVRSENRMERVIYKLPRILYSTSSWMINLSLKRLSIDVK